MTTKVSERDPPSRAEYAAAMKWWQIFRLTSFCFVPGFQLRGVLPPEGYGPVRRWLLRYGFSFRLDGTPNLCEFLLVGPVTIASVGGSGLLCWHFFGAWAAIPGAVLGTIPPLAVAITVQVIWFRAGGWEQVLEKRDLKLGQKT